MKIISLNTWGGKAGHEELLAFFCKHKEVDVFCLQEIWSGGEEMLGKIAGSAELIGIDTNLLKNIQKVLPDYVCYFRPHFNDYYGLALFVHKKVEVLNEGELFVYRERGFINPNENGDHARNLQHIRIRSENHEYVIAQVHGLWNGQGKGDSEARLIQSDNIAQFVMSLNVPVVLVGDFNLRPDTESVRKLETIGMCNLISDFGITSTRTTLYTKSNEQFADYAFVSEGITVNDFKVLPDEVSDHAPLYVDVSLA